MPSGNDAGRAGHAACHTFLCACDIGADFVSCRCGLRQGFVTTLACHKRSHVCRCRLAVGPITSLRVDVSVLFEASCVSRTLVQALLLDSAAARPAKHAIKCEAGTCSPDDEWGARAPA